MLFASSSSGVGCTVFFLNSSMGLDPVAGLAENASKTLNRVQQYKKELTGRRRSSFRRTS
jgi:hypothetical protein